MQAALIALAVVVLAACGGGGGTTPSTRSGDTTKFGGWAGERPPLTTALNIEYGDEGGVETLAMEAYDAETKQAAMQAVQFFLEDIQPYSASYRREQIDKVLAAIKGTPCDQCVATLRANRP